MSGGQEDVSSQPLVIVRRRRNTEEAHHGGVWKIAYADFMTAMMAFFLVMWLVNAADKKTIVQVAAYFNPVRLTDRTVTPKGLEEMTEDAKAADKQAKKGHNSKVKEEEKDKSEPPQSDGADMAGEGASANEKKAQSQKEQALFDNPRDTLDKLADAAKSDQISESDVAYSDTGENDPFDRQNRTFRKRQGAAKAEQKPAKPADAITAKPAVVPPPSAIPNPPGNPNVAKAELPASAQSMTPPTPPATEVNKDDKLNDKKNDKNDDKRADKVDAAAKVETELSRAISKVSRKLPHVEVKSTAEGLLISLMDDAAFGMFEVGSAKPNSELVVIMGKVGELLKTTPGKIVVRGHTDSRAYKSGNYDNWRLSAARAQMAYYMLVRGGVPEANFIAVEGRADRDPKLPNDTEAAQNRRIDILIRDAPP